MISYIIQEHQEGREFINTMLSQIEELKGTKEVIFVTSANAEKINIKREDYDYPIRIFYSVQSPGRGRTVGGENAIGDYLLFLDCHICLTQEAVDRLIQTMAANKDAAVGAAIDVGDFPVCNISPGAYGHGVCFTFKTQPWEWTWIPATELNHEFIVPCCCCCAFGMNRQLFSILDRYGGFIYPRTGVGIEEEFGIRLWRLGGRVLVEPRSKMSHYFKGYTGHTSQDTHSQAGYIEARCIATYVNVFNPMLWAHIENLCINTWGSKWYDGIDVARTSWGWLRAKMEPYKDKINETYFFR